MSAILMRVLYLVVGYCWACFVAAIAISVLRSGYDYLYGLGSSVNLASPILLAGYSTAILTLGHLMDLALPTLAAIAGLEVLRMIKAPALPVIALLAGAGVGYLVAHPPGTDAINDRNELIYSVSGWALGLLACWWMSLRDSQSVQSALQTAE